MEEMHQKNFWKCHLFEFFMNRFPYTFELTKLVNLSKYEWDIFK